jgi:hypothetical protein
MGPREALERIAAAANVGRVTDDLTAAHQLFREIRSMTENAIGEGTLRRARLLRAWDIQSEMRRGKKPARRNRVLA